MSFKLGRDRLLELFGSVGPVVDVIMPLDRVSGRPQGFAFVKYETGSDGAKALEMLSGMKRWNEWTRKYEVGSSGGVDSRKCQARELLRLQAKKYPLLPA